MATPKELLDDLLKDVKHPEDLLGKNGLFKQLTKDLVERVLEEELTDHIGYEKHAVEGRGTGTSHNGKSEKILQGEQGKFPLCKRSVAPRLKRIVRAELRCCRDLHQTV